MYNILKLAVSLMAATTLLNACTETTGGKTTNDSIPATVSTSAEAPSNELIVALLRVKLKGKFDYVSGNYNEGLMGVIKGGKHGFCDSTGKEVIPCIYDLAYDFTEGAASVKKDGLIGFIDKTGKELFPFRKYDYAAGFDGGLSSFRIIKNNKELYGFIDKAGNEVVPPIYSDARISWFNKGSYAIVQKGGKWGTITKQNAVVVPFEYEDINDFKNGITTAKKAGKWGVIDTANKVLVPFTMTYKTVYEFNSGYAHVENKDNLKGFIDINGKEVFGGLRFAEAFGFGDDGYTMVSEPGGSRYIMYKDGTTLFKDANLEDIDMLSENEFIITRNAKQGIVDKNNKVLVPIEYTRMMAMGKNLLLVVKDSASYYTDYRGKKVADYTE